MNCSVFVAELKASLALMVIVHLIEALSRPPENLPDLHTLMITEFSFVNFAIALLLAHFAGWEKQKQN